MKDCTAVGEAGEEYSPSVARRLIEGTLSDGRRERIELHGIVTDRLVLDDPLPPNLTVAGVIRGGLTVAGTLAGSLRIAPSAEIDGDLSIGGAGRVGSTLEIEGRVAGSLRIDHGGTIGGSVQLGGTAYLGDVHMTKDGSVSGSLTLHDDATIDRYVLVHRSASIGGTIYASERTRIGRIQIGGEGVLGEHILIAGETFVRSIEIDRGGTVGGRIDLGGTATAGTVSVRGAVIGGLELDSTVQSGVLVDGRAAHIALRGEFSGPVHLAPRDGLPVPLASVSGGRFAQPVHIGERVSITSCDFRRCADVDRLDLVGGDLFRDADGQVASRIANPPMRVALLDERPTSPHSEMASIYRQLRVNLEGKGNRPASAFFYRGEMDSRRRAARQRGGWAGWTEWAWISLYRVVAGYGLRVLPPLLWFGVLVGLGEIGFHALDLGRDWPATFVYTAQAMLSLFRPPDPSDDWRVGLLQIGLRVLGPVLLGLAAFAVRDKVAR